MTTSERNGLLSHFAVHLSPIWYVLLPFYCLFPSPYTLQAGQAVILASGLIPLYLFMPEARAFPEKHGTFLCPVRAVSGPKHRRLYDIHENCFLTAASGAFLPATNTEGSG